MPRLKCDTRIEKPVTDIVDRVFDLRNRVKWLKNVEYCLLGDQTDRLTKIQTERHDLEMENKTLREKIKQADRCKDERDCIDYHRNRVMEEHNQLIFIQRSLSNRLQALQKEATIVKPIKIVRKTEILARRIRDIQDRLTSVKLMNKTLKTCKQHLQCDLDLLGKELPNIQKDIAQKSNQKTILRKEFMDILTENKRHLKEYQQLLNQTEMQSQQRRAIHEQAMASVTEQLEDPYHVQITGANDMTTSLESRKLNVGTNSTTNLTGKNLPMMNNDEIIQVRCMHEQFYNMIISGYPIDLNIRADLPQENSIPHEISTMLIMTNRMMEEKEQINEQIYRTDKLLKLIEMSLNRKNDTRQKIVDTMTEQRQQLELLYTNDIVDEQNRILRQINDFTLVLFNLLYRYIDTQSLNEPPIDFIERLQYLFDLMKTTIENQPIDEDRNSFPSVRRSDGDENSQFPQSINSSLSSLSSRMKRNVY